MKSLALVGAFLCLAPIGIAHASETTNYTYDELGRLVTAATQGGPNNGVSTTTSFDPAGNRNSYAVAGGGGCTIVALDGGSTDEFTAYAYVQPTSTCSGPVTIGYSTQDGTGVAHTHYYPASGTITLQPSDTYKWVTVSPIYGSVPSGQNRIFYVNFTIQSGNATLTDAQSKITIESSN